MHLTELCRRYVCRVGGKASYLHQMLVLVRRLPWQAESLSPDLIDAYLTSALHTLSPATVAKHRRMLSALLKFAAQEGLVNKSTVERPIRRVKTPHPCPVAWTQQEIVQLIRAAETFPGGTRHCEYRLLLPAWIRMAYITGLRPCDLLAVTHASIRGSRIALRQQKTGYPHVVMLDDATLKAIAALPKNGPEIFGSLISGVQVVRAMKRLVKFCRLEGSTKYLRRSGATYCEARGRDASQYLGHRSPGMKVHYVDRLLLSEERDETPLAPPLPDAC
jgi:integrase